MRGDIDAALQRLPCAGPRGHHSQVNVALFSDLKPANIMVRGKIYKIGDFGFSKQFRLNATGEIDQLTMKTTVGTPLYMSL